MPRVPETPIGGVSPAALPGARRESVVTPGLLSGEADDRLELGQSLVAAGTGFGAVAYRMNERENADALFKAETGDKEAYVAFDARMRESRQGDLAKDTAKDTAAWWKERIDRNMAALENDEQRRMYSQRIVPIQLQSVHSISQFEAAQTDLAHDRTWKADKTSSINLAAATPTPTVVSSSIADLVRMNGYQAARKGWSPEVLQAVNAEDITSLHKEVIQGLVRTNKDQAAAYFETHKEQINGSQRAELGELAEKATAAAVGLRAASSIWAELGPKGDRDTPEVDKMQRRAREMFGDNTFALEATRVQLTQMTSEFKDGRAERGHQRLSAVAQATEKGATFAKVQQMPEFLGMSGVDQQNVRKHFEADAAAREARAAARENRLAAVESREFTASQRAAFNQARETDAAYFRYSDPTVLSAMSRAQVESLYFVMGREHTSNLLQRYDSFERNGAKLSEGKIDRQDFLQIADAAGLPAFVHKPTDDQSARMVRLQSAVENAIGTRQTEVRRELTRAEKNSVMRDVLNNEVLISKFGSTGVMPPFFWWRSKPEPLATLTPEETGENTKFSRLNGGAYTLVEGGHQVYMNQIPQEARKEIADLRSGSGNLNSAVSGNSGYKVGSRAV